MSGHIQKQLTRSLERILEEAHLSGELKLSGRKLKDFPKVGKTGAAKYNLQDTVIAGESFGESCERCSENDFPATREAGGGGRQVRPAALSVLLSPAFLAPLSLHRSFLFTSP